MNKKVIENEIKWHTENVVGSVPPIKIPDEEITKYRFCKDWQFNPKQRMFMEMGNLLGKMVLDFGSGQGINAVEMALLGANVTGFDVVPGLVNEATTLADLNGVKDSCQFYIAEASADHLHDCAYDIVLIDNVLHHIPREDFDNVLEKANNAAKIGGKLIIREPIEFSGIFSKIKSIFSIGVPISPDECELSRADVDFIITKLGNCQLYYYGLTARLMKYVANKYILNLSMKFDQALFKAFQSMRCLAGVIVIVSRKTADSSDASNATREKS